MEDDPKLQNMSKESQSLHEEGPGSVVPLQFPGQLLCSTCEVPKTSDPNEEVAELGLCPLHRPHPGGSPSQEGELTAICEASLPRSKLEDMGLSRMLFVAWAIGCAKTSWSWEVLRTTKIHNKVKEPNQLQEKGIEKKLQKKNDPPCKEATQKRKRTRR
ncbi:uncharacterized protein RBU57_005693 isoform 1-T1 [Macrochelys suwanniensis]